MRVNLTLRSDNIKTGPIPVSITSSDTCPPDCPLMGAGCYAEHGPLRIIWRRVSKGGGLTWRQFVARVRALPTGILWRHNVAGDLPGAGNSVDTERLTGLVNANRGKRGFTYTHKPVGRGYAENRKAISAANKGGFTVNLSADSEDEADQFVQLGIGPVALTVPTDYADRKPWRTAAGNRVIVCPFDRPGRAPIQCVNCKLCADANRKSIVAFPAHGARRRMVSERLLKGGMK